MIGSKTIFGFQVIYWYDMKYGIESESLAVNSFLSNTGNKVITSRLGDASSTKSRWLNV